MAPMKFNVSLICLRYYFTPNLKPRKSATICHRCFSFFINIDSTHLQKISILFCRMLPLYAAILLQRSFYLLLCNLGTVRFINKIEAHGNELN